MSRIQTTHKPLTLVRADTVKQEIATDDEASAFVANTAELSAALKKRAPPGDDALDIDALAALMGKD